MNCKSYVHQISEIGPIEQVRLSCEHNRVRSCQSGDAQWWIGDVGKVKEKRK